MIQGKFLEGFVKIRLKHLTIYLQASIHRLGAQSCAFLLRNKYTIPLCPICLTPRKVCIGLQPRSLNVRNQKHTPILKGRTPSEVCFNKNQHLELCLETVTLRQNWGVATLWNSTLAVSVFKQLKQPGSLQEQHHVQHTAAVKTVITFSHSKEQAQQIYKRKLTGSTAAVVPAEEITWASKKQSWISKDTPAVNLILKAKQGLVQN